MPAQQYRRICFTCHALSPIHETDLSKSGVSFGIVGSEVCPKTSKRHYQGYYEFAKKITLSAYKSKICDKCHIEPARGTPSQNVTYCSKETVLKTFGKTRQQGERTDLDAICDEMLEHPLHEVIVEHTATYIRNYRGIKDALCAISPPLPRKVELVHVLPGQSPVDTPNDIYVLHTNVDYKPHPYFGQSCCMVFNHTARDDRCDGKNMALHDMIVSGAPCCISDVPCKVDKVVYAQVK